MALSAGVVRRLGGTDRLRAAGPARAEALGEGAWVQASVEVDAMTDEQLARMREVLTPALRIGPRVVADFAEEPRLRL